MADNFADRVVAAVLAKKSQVCVGLDPRLKALPPFLVEKHRLSGSASREAIAGCFADFTAAIIDAVAPAAVAVKLQLACFEQYGPPGLGAFEEISRQAAAAGLLVIADAKRGDIGISAGAYSAAFIGRPEGLEDAKSGASVDALTVNPLFGTDGMEPFLADCAAYGKGIFILVKTSNPGSAELQDLALEAGGLFHEAVAVRVKEWGEGLIGVQGYSSAGAVVGATHAGPLRRLRQQLPRAIFLLPGYGAQGAAAADVAAAFDERGLGALVTASRSIIYAGSDEDYAVRAGEAARQMRDELWQAGTGAP